MDPLELIPKKWFAGGASSVEIDRSGGSNMIGPLLRHPVQYTIWIMRSDDGTSNLPEKSQNPEKLLFLDSVFCQYCLILLILMFGCIFPGLPTNQSSAKTPALLGQL